MNMSCRHAWALVDEVNRICGRAVVEPREGANTAAALNSRRLACLWLGAIEGSNGW